MLFLFSLIRHPFQSLQNFHSYFIRITNFAYKRDITKKTPKHMQVTVWYPTVFWCLIRPAETERLVQLSFNVADGISHSSDSFCFVVRNGNIELLLKFHD